MKELSVEEKAKRYDEAIEKLRSLHDDYDTVSTLIDIKEELENIFPELCESEDEKVRKAILELVRQSSEILDKQNQNNMISWLEKHGQKPRKVSIWKHWKNGIAGNGEGEPIYLIKAGNTYNLSSCLSFECDYIELSELDNLMLEKQGEQKQKPTNEDMKEALRTEYEKGRADAIAQMQQEWSEEDERIRQCLIQDQEEALDDVCNDKYGHSEIISDLKEMYHERIDWLKSLKERYTWKPSDEQMKTLYKILNCNVSSWDLNSIYSLYNDLKKLTE